MIKTYFTNNCSLKADAWISQSKPKLVFNCIEELCKPVRDFAPIRADELEEAHSENYVRRVLSLDLPNGFGNKDVEELQQILWAGGAMREAIRQSLTHGITFAPVSGFHHAGYEYCMGFCTFNSMVAALVELKREGKIQTAAIIDGDAHYGNGTDDIIERLGLDWLTNVTNRRGGANTWKQFKSEMMDALSAMPDVVVYQAGADALLSDPFKAGYLSSAQFKKRDETLFRTCKALGIPVAFNIAGGYHGKRTVFAHYQTFITATGIYYPEVLQGHRVS